MLKDNKERLLNTSEGRSEGREPLVHLQGEGALLVLEKKRKENKGIKIPFHGEKICSAQGKFNSRSPG